ncbi:MAG: hypothetical protein G01um10142_467 [Parcubacteria group bacterium Gr01-1014_2]|nr:MAG: hypothetical protein G01um10142_467 [Parcubacteria group bacterium Gr01-1014_2]
MEFFDFQFLSETFKDLKLIFSFLAPFKLVVLPIVVFIVFFIFKDAWLYYRQSLYKNNRIQWDMVEVKIPREIETGPKAMEQFFTALWTLRNAAEGFKERFWDGEVTRWFSFEMVGDGGLVKFYIRMPKRLRHTIESMLYAQYPNIEIIDAVDYTDELPSSVDKIHELGFEIWGNEMVLGKSSAYPINTYQLFEDKEGAERLIDPISMITEIMGKLKTDEKIWIQFLIRPANPAWAKESQALIEEYKKKAAPAAQAVQPGQIPRQSFRGLAPNEEEELKLIGRKMSKPAYETLIRYIYTAPRDTFNADLPKRGLAAYFGQYGSPTLNYFLSNFGVRTDVSWYRWPFFFAKKRLRERRKKILFKYRTRFLPEESFLGRVSESNILNIQLNKKSGLSIFNAEELATLYHFPTNVVLTGSVTERIESKRVSPPRYIPYE